MNSANPLRHAAAVVLGSLLLSSSAGRTANSPGLQFPGKQPGPTRVELIDGRLTVSNAALSAVWEVSTSGVRPVSIHDNYLRRSLRTTGEVFRIVFTNGLAVPASGLVLQGPPSVTSREAGRSGGNPIREQRSEATVRLRSPDGRVNVRWRVVASDQANYIRQFLDVLPETSGVIGEIQWFDQIIPGAGTAGSVDGSPVVIDSYFLGCEDPHARNEAAVEQAKVGAWAGSDLVYRERRRKTWPVDARLLSSGTNRFRFTYTEGPHRLDIWGFSVLQDGREIARDGHHGFTGTSSADTVYQVVLDTISSTARYEVAAEIGTDPEFTLAPGAPLDSEGILTVERKEKTRVFCRLPRNAPLPRGETLTQSFVVGVAPSGQLRRAFLYYLERERAHPYRPYLHYNSWYDTAWDPFTLNETNCLEAIRLMGENLVKARHVKLDGLVFDDGWDNPRSLWGFHSGFPRGFTPLAELCAEYNTRLGIWLSPFGGYGAPRDQRLQFGREQGYEINTAGFSLAGTKYYGAFKNACVGMIRKYGVNHFKFDGIAAGMSASGGAEYVLDTEAMRRLMLELRAEDPDVFINLTTGSWPSPFWLHYADSVWRQGADMGLAGVGTRQQQWITYRDQETYRNIVVRGPLYPLNSLMSQGVAYSRKGSAGDPSFNSAGFKQDVRGFFGSGTALQELYIQPGRLTSEDWDVLAEAAKWSRAHADVLVDTHWVGGDPGRLEPYGYASWNAGRGVLMLRNPADRPQSITIDVQAALELPANAPGKYTLRSAWAEHRDLAPLTAQAGTPITLPLAPFEIQVLEAKADVGRGQDRSQGALPRTTE